MCFEVQVIQVSARNEESGRRVILWRKVGGDRIDGLRELRHRLTTGDALRYTDWRVEKVNMEIPAA